MGILPAQPLGMGGISVSRIALGCMGLAGTFNPDEGGEVRIDRAITAFEAALEAGITFFDHADIYGGTACESLFKECLAAVPGSRERIIIATKGTIHDGLYEHTPSYLRACLQRSLKRLGVEYIDLYQLHRPDPLGHPAETAAVLDEFIEQGLVRAVGVSNYYPHQVAALRQYLRAPLVSNQISISLLRLAPIYEGEPGGPGDGVLDQCMEYNITPMAYSPLGGGWLTGQREMPVDRVKQEALGRIFTTMREMSERYEGATPTQLALAWLLRHPAKIIPIVGSIDPAHIQEATAAVSIHLTQEDWYALWVAARGVRMP